MTTRSQANDRASHYVNQRGRTLLKRYHGSARRRQAVAESMYEASQRELVLAKFKKHRLAVISLFLLAVVFLVAAFAEFLAPYDKLRRFEDSIYAGPTKVHFTDDQGSLVRPYVYATTTEVDPATFRYETAQPSRPRRYELTLFPKTEPYRLAGLIPMDRRLFGVEGNQPLFLLGSDHLGRDVLSRIIHASRISLLVGFGGVLISFALGVVLGGISGYFGGRLDGVIQRLIEFLISIPLIPLWMALSAAVPQSWSGIQTYFAITIILSLVGWTGLARVIRGKIIALREEDYITAARVSSAGHLSIIFRHLVPGFTSFLIVHITISIPAMILGETTLSFLGLGITAPDVSWGSLLQDAQDITVVSNYPWLLAPAAFLVVAVILFNFVGDGLRDAADPYSR